VNVVAVPYDLADQAPCPTSGAGSAGPVRRYFLRLAQAGATLAATVTLTDSGQQTAKAILYEPMARHFESSRVIRSFRSADPR